MEVEQVFPITTNVDTSGDSVIAVDVSDNKIPSISIEEKVQYINGASADNGDDKREEISTPISRSASSPNRWHAKKHGAFNLFRAMFMSFSRNSSMKKRGAVCDEKKAEGDKSAATAASANEVTWKNLVDGMRPLSLHGQLEYYPPPPPLGHDVYHDVLLPPPSPAWSEGMTSHYASAQDLQQLDNGHEEEEEQQPQEKDETTDSEDGAGACPHAIDVLAEEFIAKFYEQFRLQKSDSFNDRAK